MDTSSAYRESLDPTNLDNFKNELLLPGRDGLLGLLETSADPMELVAQRERVVLAPGMETEMLVYRAERDGMVWLNPTFLVETGDAFSVSLTNGLDEETTKKVIAARPFSSLEDPKIKQAIPADVFTKLEGKINVKPSVQ